MYTFMVYHMSSKKVYNKVYNIFVFVFLKGYRFYIDTFRFFYNNQSFFIVALNTH